MWLEIVLGLLALLLYFYHYVTKQFGFFEELGIPFSKPYFPFGSSNVFKMFTGKLSVTELDVVVANEFPGEKVVGYFMFGQPQFVVNDEELAKRILVKDFSYFMDRREFKSTDKIFQNFLTNLQGAEWKQMRSLMSGVFTSGKLKLMSKHIATVGKNFECYIAGVTEKGEEQNMKDLGGLLTLDSIASAGFGIDVDSFQNPENEFRKMALTLTGAPGYQEMLAIPKFLLAALFPKVASYLNISVMPYKPMNFFSDIIRRTYKERQTSAQKRNDIIDVIVAELKGEKSKKTNYESEFEKDAALDTSDIKNITEVLDEETILISNAVLFFFAGFDTSATGLAMVTHKLASYPEFQDKVLEEIDEVVGDSEDVTFDQIQELKYLDMFINESFRLQALLTSLERQCTKNYNIPGTDITIPEGRIVKVYTYDISTTENNFKSPKEFDPENFAAENTPNKFGMMMFGQGPRNCIGMRYALLTLKYGLVYMLRKHRLVRTPNTPEKLEISITNMNTFKQPIMVKIESR
jgi:cytochrome P450